MGVLQPLWRRREAQTAWLSPLIANVIQHFKHTVHYLGCVSRAIVQTPAGEPHFCGNTCPLLPQSQKISCTDEYHRWHSNPLPCVILSVHMKQAVGIELHALSYLNPKVIVDDAIPVHINPSRGKLVGI